MKWGDLIAASAADAGLSRAAAERVVRALMERTHQAVVEGERVTLPGLGTLHARWREERALRSVHDQRKVVIDGAWTPVFRSSITLRTALRSKSAQLLKDPRHQAAWRLAETLLSDLALYTKARLPSFPGDADDAAVNAQCQAAIGADWRQARATYDRSVDAEVRAARDYLVDAARRRFTKDS